MVCGRRHLPAGFALVNRLQTSEVLPQYLCALTTCGASLKGMRPIPVLGGTEIMHLALRCAFLLRNEEYR